MNTKLIIVGAAGRMGARVVAMAKENGSFDIVGAVEAPDRPEIGKDPGTLAGVGELGIEITEDYPLGAEVVIDFSGPQAADKTIDYCLENSAALVMGTTGLNEKQQQKIQDASKKIPLLYGTNMSVGMNVLFALVGQVAQMLGDGYDIEIVEQHHRFKKDSPSGTAFTLAENIAKATDRDYPGCLVHGREGKDVPRKEGNIGMHAVRAGDITGIHSVIFGTLGETIELNHRASNRDNFVRGAVRAAQWLSGKNPGWYSMADVLGLK